MKYFLLILTFLFSSFAYSDHVDSYIETTPVEQTMQLPHRIDFLQNKSKPSCQFSNEESCFDNCPSGYSGSHIIYWGGNTSSYMKRCYACPSNSDVVFNGQKIDPFTTNIGGYAWTCVTKYCPDTYTLSGDGTICIKEVKCNSGINNEICGHPTYPAKCLSDQEQYLDENDRILCLQACPVGSVRDEVTKKCIFEEIEEEKGSNEGDCKGSIINSVKCLEEKTTKELDTVSTKTDNVLTNLLELIKDFFNNEEEEEEENNQDSPMPDDPQSTDDLKLEDIQLPIFEKTITIESKSIFPTKTNCPSNNTINLFATTFSFSYSKLCSYLNLLSNIVMILAFYFGYKIVRSE